jgi:hypothetical protein
MASRIVSAVLDMVFAWGWVSGSEFSDWRGAVMWFAVKEGEASIIGPRNRSYGLVAGPDERVVPGRECGEIVEPLPTQAPEQSIWS